MDGIAAVLEALTVHVDRFGRADDEPDAGPLASEVLWQLRLDELDRAFRAPDGSELPIPGRPAVLARMADFDDQARFTWTNHAAVDKARKALKERREQATRSAGTQPAADQTAEVAKSREPRERWCPPGRRQAGTTVAFTGHPPRRSGG